MTSFASTQHTTTSVLDTALRPGDEGYAEAVRTLTGDGRPELVLRPTSAEEVADAVRLSQERDLALTVRAGGHSVAGLTQASDGLLLDLRRLLTIEVEPESRLVRVDGGATWGQVAQALRPYGLGLTAGDTSSVGVGGLTLGGGIGWMVRRHGLAIDSLVGAEVVTADGRILQVSAGRHRDLFWALRGGGGGFGVVTRFDFVAQPVDDVVFGTVTFALDAPLPLLTAWRTLQHEADERLTTVLNLVPRMGDQPAIATLGICFAGDWAEARPVVDPLLRLGPVISSDVGLRPYADVLVGDEMPPGLRFAMSNTFLPALGIEARADLVRILAAGGIMISLRALGGAMGRIAPEDTAFAHRSGEVMATGIRILTEDLAAGEEAVPGWSAIAARGTGSYVNFLSGVGPEASAACYPAPTSARLAEAKATYDPTDVFRRTVNVSPANARGVSDV